MSLLDIFNDDAFGLVTLTDTINKVPFVPGQAGRAVSWNSRGVPTLSVAIEERSGFLELVNPTPRGGVGTARSKDKSILRDLRIPHYEKIGGIMADEVQGVREFGTESSVKTVQGMVNNWMNDIVMLAMDPTLEYQRVGALKGVILNADGSTLYNLFTEFGVSAHADINLPLSATTDTGAVRGACQDVLDAIADELGGLPMGRVKAFAGKNAWKALIAAKEVRATYLNWQQAVALRAGTPYESVFEFGDIAFERYRGTVGSTAFIADDEFRFFVDMPGLYRTVYAPADYVETVNTVGLPRYMRQRPMSNGKGIELEAQMNALSYCLRPATLIKGTFTTP